MGNRYVVEVGVVARCDDCPVFHIIKRGGLGVCAAYGDGKTLLIPPTFGEHKVPPQCPIEVVGEWIQSSPHG